MLKPQNYILNECILWHVNFTAYQKDILEKKYAMTGPNFLILKTVL